MQRLMCKTAVRALAPYRDTSRFVTFRDAGEVIPGVRPVDLGGHTPGHTGYLVGEGDETVLFWGDTIHSHAVQLRRPEVAVATDSAEPGAVAARRKLLELASSNRWWVGADHLCTHRLTLDRDLAAGTKYGVGENNWHIAFLVDVQRRQAHTKRCSPTPLARRAPP
jgi:glyoxylase-like metal-dependent hydrolase (beta-lactamase superfamily II)